jgi:hypothetical protein
VFRSVISLPLADDVISSQANIVSTLLENMKVTAVENAVQLLHVLSDIVMSASGRPNVLIVDGLGPLFQELRSGSSHHLQGVSSCTTVMMQLCRVP